MHSVATRSPLGQVPKEPAHVTTSEVTTSHQPSPVVVDDDSQLRTLDDFLINRARRFKDQTVLSYPSSGINYVDYSMQQLNVFGHRAACHYREALQLADSPGGKPHVVAVLGPSDLEYAVSMLGLIKLGHTILFLSTRISAEAIESLMKATGAKALIADSRFAGTAKAVGTMMPETRVLDMASRSVFEFAIKDGEVAEAEVQLSPRTESSHIVYIIHSSGSTGFPKPIYQTHMAALKNYANNMNMKAFITLPLFHNHGICNFFRALQSGRSIHMYNADLPLTSDYLTSILLAHDFEIFYGVPYALKLLAETEKGISILRDLKIVMYGGSACPDELGDLLVNNGVNLISHYGATEVGQLMTSFRPAGDKAWNYVREFDALSPYLNWIPRGPNLYECCVREGWPSKLTSNLPDNSYATKDLFEPHPTIPKAWKYIARLDDTIVLVNGEKANPVTMEGKIRSEPSVTECVIFGAGRTCLGLLVVPSPAVDGKTTEEITDLLWPVVEEANQRVEAYSRISKNMIKLLPGGTEYPRTDKGSIIRQAFYKNFAKEIDETYDAADAQSGELQVLDAEGLKAFLRPAAASLLGVDGERIKDDDDFFTLGMDSLKSTQLRSEILRNIDVGGQKVGQNVVFDHASLTKLATYLLSLRTGQTPLAEVSIETLMQSLLNKYTNFGQKSSVVVTGATGSLGAHVVAKLAADPSITHIYCLVRAENDSQAMSRVTDSLSQRQLLDSISTQGRNKLRAVPSRMSDPRLGMTDAVYEELTSNLSSVIHCAWSVNFSMHLSSFEHDCIAGARHLIDLCLASGSKEPASYNFCSSVSTVARASADPVPEQLPAPEWAQTMGYAQSKWVAEHMCIKAAEATGIKARVLRVGQIIGDTQHGIWNATEAIPLQLQTALTLGLLPQLPETPSWLPVDTVAQAVVDISLSAAGSVVTNVVNKNTFSWTNDLLPALRNAGLTFEEVTPREWVRRLRESNTDLVANPPFKLVEFFAAKYDKDLTEMGPSKNYATATACSLSPALENAAVLDQDTVNKFVQYFMQTSWKGSEGQGRV